jgi:hypothetical protein
MQMQMMYGLSAVIASVDDHPVPLVKLLCSRQIGSRSHQMPKQRLMASQCLCLRDNVLFWDKEEMSRSLGVDVGKTDAELVFIDAVRRDFSGKNLTEQAVSIHL